MGALDRHLPDFDVSEVHARVLEVPPEAALARMLAVPAGSDPLVRALFRLRGVRGSDLPLARFVTERLGLPVVERTATTAVMAGPLHGLRIGISFEAEPRDAGSRLVTETRVADAGWRFRLYWLVVGPFSALIRRRWLLSTERAGRILAEG